MAKTLDKVTKEYDQLKTKLQVALGSLKEIKKTADALFANLQETSREAGEQAAKLRAKGQAGTKLDDFVADPELKKLRQFRNDQFAKLKGQETALNKETKNIAELKKDLGALKKTLDGEIKTRGRKKLILIDSKSLPGLKALLAQINTDEGKLDADIDEEIEYIVPLIDIDRRKKSFDDDFARELGKTKVERQKEEGRGLVNRLYDSRVQQKYRTDAKRHFAVVQTKCTEAKAAVSAGGDYKAKLVDASKERMALKKIADLQRSAANDVASSITKAKRDGEAKLQKTLAEVKKSMDTITALDDAADALLKKTATDIKAVTAAPPARARAGSDTTGAAAPPRRRSPTS